VAKGGGILKRVICSGDHISTTIDHLREGGLRNSETVVLWLARRSGKAEVSLIVRPEQTASEKRFWIDPNSMRNIMNVLVSQQLRIIAQVHSHPGAAFHSKADDEWAIIRQVGALSIVVPYFAHKITINNFIDKSAIYRHSENGNWDKINGSIINSILKIEL
jgi:proteasome lid subunit RPN8/RPN11